MKRLFTLLTAMAILSFASRTDAQVGYNCDSAVVITALPYAQSGLNTNTVGNPYTSADVCGSTYMDGNDYVFKFIPSIDMNVSITLSNTGQAVGVFISKNCFDDPNALCIAQATNLIGNPSIANTALQKDSTYFILVSTNALLGANQSTPFDISVTELLQVDASVSAITSPVSGCDLGAQNVTILITNPGADSLYDFEVAYNFNGQGIIYETVPDTILPGDSLYYTFTSQVIFTGPGEYNLIAYTSISADGDHSNDTTTAIIMNRSNVSVFPYDQDFEAGADTWITGGTNSSWAFGTPASAIINQAASGVNAWKTNLTGNCNAPELSYIESHCFDMSSLILPIIEMNVWFETSTTGYLYVQYSINGGSSWTTIGVNGDPDNWYNGMITIGWTGDSGQWINAKHVVPAIAGQANVIFRIQFNEVTTATEGAAFDDFRVYESPEDDLGVTQIITPSSGCGLTSAETVSVMIRNFGIGVQSNFPVVYSPDGGSNFITETVNATLLPGDSINYSFNTGADLSVEGVYDFVATTGLAGDANNTNDTMFKTITVFLTNSIYPYNDNFDDTISYWSPGGTSSSWVLGTPAKPTINSASSSPNSWVTSLTGDHNANENSWVESPCLDFSSLSNPFIKFDIWYQTSFLGSAQLQASADDGASWTTIGANGDPNNWYNGLLSTGWTGSAGGWLTASHLINSFGGVSDARLRIQFNGGFFLTDEGVAFDNIHIFDCVIPVAGFFTTPNDLTISFTNTSTNGTSYLWDFGDGTTSTLESPTHTYSLYGSYNVTLTVSTNCATDVATSTLLILGIDEYSNDNHISVYPNPTTGICTLTINNISSDNTSIAIYNMQGQLVYGASYGKVNSTTVKELDISDLAKGVYYLKLTCDKENHVARIVVE